LDFFEVVRLIALRALFAKMFLLVLPGVAQPKNQSVERLWTVPVTTRVAGNNDDGSAGAFAIKPRVFVPYLNWGDRAANALTTRINLL
jgi:hypothetical protein